MYMTVLKNNELERALSVSRILDAPIELVWKIWTTPDHIKNWWGPNGFTNTISKLDLQPGGDWELVMHGPDGTNYKNKSTFREVIRHEKIVYDHITAPKFRTTVTFEAAGAKTMLDWHMLFESKEVFDQAMKTFKADEGLKQNVEKLSAYISMMNKIK